MQLQFQVHGQHIMRTDFSRVVAGSKNYVSCRFSFNADWAGLVKTAVFEKDGIAYHAVLTNDMVEASAMPTLSEGIWNVSVFGGDLMTADMARLPVERSGFCSENLPAAPETSVYESLTALIQENIDKTEALENKIVGGGTPIEIDGETMIIGL